MTASWRLLSQPQTVMSKKFKDVAVTGGYRSGIARAGAQLKKWLEFTAIRRDRVLG